MPQKLPKYYCMYGCVQMWLCILGEHFWKCSRWNIFLLSIPFNSPRWVLLNGNIKRTIFHILQYEKCSPNVFLTIDVDSHYLKVAFWFECWSPLKIHLIYTVTTGPPICPLFHKKPKILKRHQPWWFSPTMAAYNTKGIGPTGSKQR